MRRDNLLGERMFSHKLNSVINRVKLFSNIISNFKSEFVLNGHDQLNNVERVQFKVIYKVSGGSNLNHKRSSLKKHPTLLASTASKFLTTSSIRVVTSSLGKKVQKINLLHCTYLRTKESHTHSISNCRDSLRKSSEHFKIKNV